MTAAAYVIGGGMSLFGLAFWQYAFIVESYHDDEPGHVKALCERLCFGGGFIVFGLLVCLSAYALTT